MTSRLICITGNTAVGTTTLTRRLNEIRGWHPIYSEAYLKKSPFFERFLNDPLHWAFHNQVFFISEYLDGYRRSIHTVESEDKIICLDYSLDELEVYTRAMHTRGFFDLHEYKLLLNIINLFSNTFQKPDLLIYLTAPTNVLLDRLRERGRGNENRIDREYLIALEHNFQEWYQKWNSGPMLVINSEENNFFEDIIVRRIATKCEELVRLLTAGV